MGQSYRARARLVGLNAACVQEVISGPPEGWQLTETPGDTHMTLKKTHGSEKIQIDLMVNDQVSKTSATQLQLCPCYC